MKPFSMRHILKDTCNNHPFQRKRKQSLCEMKKAPKKPILKPFQEEEQSPMGHLHCAPAATNNQRMQSFFPFIKSTAKVLVNVVLQDKHGENRTM